MQVVAVKLGTVVSSPSGVTETRGTYAVPIMETAVRAVDNYKAKKKFIQLVPASFMSSRHIPEAWYHLPRGTGHERGLDGNPLFPFVFTVIQYL